MSNMRDILEAYEDAMIFSDECEEICVWNPKADMEDVGMTERDFH